MPTAHGAAEDTMRLQASTSQSASELGQLPNGGVQPTDAAAASPAWYSASQAAPEGGATDVCPGTNNVLCPASNIALHFFDAAPQIRRLHSHACFETRQIGSCFRLAKHTRSPSCWLACENKICASNCYNLKRQLQPCLHSSSWQHLVF